MVIKKKYQLLPLVMFTIIVSFTIFGVFCKGLEYFLGFAPDDSFYYFEIAKNLLKGHVFSFDGGITHTNGFHPLWLFVITPFVAFFQNNFIPYLLLSVFFYCLGNVVFIIIIEKLFGEKTAKSFAILLSFNPFVLIVGLNGLETGMLIFMLSLFLLVIFVLDVTQLKYMLLLSIVTALLFLTRTDSIFIIVFGWIFIFVNKIRNVKKTNCFRTVFKFFAFGILSLIIVSPWLLFNFIKFGSFIQDSGKALTYQTLQYNNANGLGWKGLFDNFKVYINGNINTTAFINGMRNTPCLVAFLILVIYCIVNKKIKLEYKQKIFIISLVFFWAIIYLSSALRFSPREWYFVIALPLLSLFCALVIKQWKQNSKNIISIVIVMFLFILNIQEIKVGLYPHQVTSMANILKSNEHFSEETRIGSSDAGIAGFFSNYHTINLDGLTNSDIIPYIREGKIFEWLDENHVEYISVRPHWYDNWLMGFGNMLRFDKNQGTSNFTKILYTNKEICDMHFRNTININEKNAWIFFGKGWSNLKDSKLNECWSNDKASTIYLPLYNEKKYVIEFELMAVSNDNNQIAVDVYQSDNFMDKWQVKPNEYQTYCLKIEYPYDLVSKIEFKYDQTYNLKKLGRSHDDRDLAICIKSIHISEM